MGPTGPILQANLNRSARVQDLFLQALTEWDAGLGVVAEPNRVLVQSNWTGDDLASVAIFWSGRRGSPPCSLVERGRGFVAVSWGDTVVVGIYAPPSWPLASFELFLDEVRLCVSHCLPRPVIVLGDFNAKATAWGSPRTDARGETLLDWAAGLELCLLNTGSVHTCVRHNGGSIVDLTFASAAAARRISGWWVAEEMETLSDHRYITMVLSTAPPDEPQGRPDGGARQSPRWSLRKLDRDALMAAAHVVAWHPDCARPADGQEGARIVLGRLRPWAPPLTESLNPQFLEQVVGTLFLQGVDNAPPASTSDPVIWSDELGVTDEELAVALKRLGAKNRTPGPDGVPGRVWVLAAGVLGAALKGVFNTCLQRGDFPAEWKTGRLVLLKKQG
ncbi:uncharacterized protein LOC143265394 [Megachile rotundata]|uniref:uncharacterized protein LOC143265394 n=1 Tax=Megachile rotundata TaxID=143995 RepID=UPI003FD2C531